MMYQSCTWLLVVLPVLLVTIQPISGLKCTHMGLDAVQTMTDCEIGVQYCYTDYSFGYNPATRRYFVTVTKGCNQAHDFDCSRMGIERCGIGVLQLNNGYKSMVTSCCCHADLCSCPESDIQNARIDALSNFSRQWPDDYPEARQATEEFAAKVALMGLGPAIVYHKEHNEPLRYIDESKNGNRMGNGVMHIGLVVTGMWWTTLVHYWSSDSWS